MVKAPWNRNRIRPTSQQGPRVPAEVEEYYNSAHKERRGIAWLLTFATLLLTLLLAVVIFFGGRWAYRALFGNNNSDSTSQEESPNGEGHKGAEQPAQNSPDSSSNGQAEDSGVTKPTPDTQQATNNNSVTNKPAAPSGVTPVTGPEAPEIPRTGPTEE